jgi:modulator of FtsH protease HflC
MSSTSPFHSRDGRRQLQNRFSFLSHLQAYERSMQHSDTHLVLRPDSYFFSYFGDPEGKAQTDSAAARVAPAGAAAPPASPPRPTSANR